MKVKLKELLGTAVVLPDLEEIISWLIVKINKEKLKKRFSTAVLLPELDKNVGRLVVKVQ